MIRLSLAFGIVLALAGSAAAQSVTLSPAVVPLGGRPGQSTSQHLTLFNGTDQALSFRLVAKDVIVRDGARAFVDAGEMAGSVAATAVFSRREVTVRPHDEASIDVTVTLPAQMTSRAVVILFQGTTRLRGNATVAIGALLTFDLSGRLSLAPGEMLATPPTMSSNAGFAIPVVNDGTEPGIVRGAVALLSARGALAGKVALNAHRLLPGERTVLSAEYPGELPRGNYRVIATLECAKQVWTRTTELNVP